MGSAQIKFDPKIMRVDTNDPKVVYDSSRNIKDSLAFSTGYVLIGVKDKPSTREIRATIQHEKSHIGEHVQGPYEQVSNLERVQRELRAYSREKGLCTAPGWNGILPTRIRDFMRYISWLSRKEQNRIKPEVKRILSPKKGGGNIEAIEKARADLAQWWLDEEPVPARYNRSTEAIRRDLITSPAPRLTTVRQRPVKPGVCFASKGRLSRRPHKGWKRVRVA